MLLGLAAGPLAGGVVLVLVGLHPDIDSPPLCRLGFLLVLLSLPVWNVVLLRREKANADEQLDEATFQAGYNLHVTQVEEAAGKPQRRRLSVPRDETEGHGH